MSTEICRVCGNKFFDCPLICYKNMPSRAQFMPDEATVAFDRGVNLNVFQCSGCGLVQLNSDPVPYYREVIRAAAFSDEMKSFRIKQFENLTKEFSLKGKKALEIGCGSGEYLSIIKKCGIDAYGIEQRDESLKHCNEIGLKVSKGFIDRFDYKVDNSPFDCFFILNFLEHLPDPNSTLRGICYNLTENATGFVEVPDFDMIIEKELFSEFIVDHLFYFTRKTLITALNLNGFEVIDCNRVWHDYILSAVVKKRSKLDISHFNLFQERLIKEINEYIDRFSEKSVAIWGAGHQSLTLISLSNISRRIKYVIDSAVFKQGKFTPATHIKIVPPEMLKTDPVEAIIVMAASYSDEVAGILKEKYDNNINIAILRESGIEIT